MVVPQVTSDMSSASVIFSVTSQGQQRTARYIRGYHRLRATMTPQPTSRLTPFKGYRDLSGRVSGTGDAYSLRGRKGKTACNTVYCKDLQLRIMVLLTLSTSLLQDTSLYNLKLLQPVFRRSFSAAVMNRHKHCGTSTHSSI